MLKKIVAVLLVISLTAAASIAGTIAYLQSEDSDVNVMTMGNVKIELVEQEWNADRTELVDFTQAKPLYPYVGDLAWTNTENEAYRCFSMANVVDKYVSVKNTGKSSAYVRTLIALEKGTLTTEEFDSMVGIAINAANGSQFQFPGTWYWGEGFDIVVDGNTYYVIEAIHENPLNPGEATIPSLLQVYLSKDATNETVEELDGNGNGTYDILVAAQAVQTAGFESAAVPFSTSGNAYTAKFALDTAFGETTDTNHPWLDGADIPGTAAPDNAEVEYNGETYPNIYDAVAAANANGGGKIMLLGSAKLDKPVEIAADITIDGRQSELTRTSDFTDTMFTVKSGATLTLNKVWLNGEDKTVTGSLVATEANSHIVLNAGSQLKNNNGAVAVNLGTRIGATLTMNGGEITNNYSNCGAIWGGGNITINGGKINNNASSGLAGAIRMVSNCNLTMNGGEICNNTAVSNGGAIYGYGASTYNFNGGKMSGNTAALGGAIYTGDSSVINISGSFEMCNNTADDAGAVRFTNYTTLNMTGGKISGNVSKNSPTWDGFYGYNTGVNISGGELADDVTIQSGYIPTIGNGNITGVIYFALGTNHNTANLAENFGSFKFHVAEGSNFSAFNFKPAAGYTYTAGDEAKLICMNEGYSTVWNASTGTFKLQAN